MKKFTDGSRKWMAVLILAAVMIVTGFPVYSRTERAVTAGQADTLEQNVEMVKLKAEEESENPEEAAETTGEPEAPEEAAETGAGPEASEETAEAEGEPEAPGETAEAAAVEASENTTELCYGLAKEIFDLVNAEREAAGISPLIWSDKIAECADVRAEEICTKFAHERPDGTNCRSMSDLIIGENIIRGPHMSAQEMVESWMESEGHRKNILNPRYTLIGIGTRCTQYGDAACQLFGREN